MKMRIFVPRDAGAIAVGADDVVAAIEQAAELVKPLVVLEPLRAGYPWASDRMHRFVIDGMADDAGRVLLGVLRAQAVFSFLAVLAHHDDRRLNCGQAGENEV